MVRAILLGLTTATIAATSAAAQNNSSNWMRVQQPWQGASPGAPVRSAPGGSNTGHPDFLWLPNSVGSGPAAPGAGASQGGYGTSLGVRRDAEKPSAGKAGGSNAISLDTPGTKKGQTKTGGIKSIGGLKSETEIVE
ncbi:MAG TPA: hypothetical protein VH765_13575 [Xanthobacteraceae bacterium]|jgi:hypothetical protein